jgi:hypothetical protein
MAKGARSSRKSIAGTAEIGHAYSKASGLESLRALEETKGKRSRGRDRWVSFSPTDHPVYVKISL